VRTWSSQWYLSMFASIAIYPIMHMVSFLRPVSTQGYHTLSLILMFK
jgi:hypothetical protein